MHTLSLKKACQPPPKTTQLHTPQEQFTEYSMFYIKYTCLTRPLSCERPLKFSKDEDFLYSACLMPNWQSCPQVSEPQILLKLMWFGCTFPLAFKKVPPWICNFLPSFWLYRKNGKMQTCEVYLAWATVVRHLPPLEGECWVLHVPESWDSEGEIKICLDNSKSPICFYLITVQQLNSLSSQWSGSARNSSMYFTLRDCPGAKATRAIQVQTV